MFNQDTFLISELQMSNFSHFYPKKSSNIMVKESVQVWGVTPYHDGIIDKAKSFLNFNYYDF